MKKNFLGLSLLLLLAAPFACKKSSDSPNPSAGLNSSNVAQDSQGNRYEVGFDQVSDINQNPYVRKLNAAGQEQWRINHEATPVDGRAVLVAIDSEDKPWVVFTMDGGSNDANYINRKELDNSNAFTGVFQNGYGSGGGPKVSILARLNPANGKIEKGSFVTARLTNGNTNTLNITKLGFVDNRPAFEISSAAWPPGEGSSYTRFPNITDADRINGSFIIYYEMNRALSSIERAQLIRP